MEPSPLQVTGCCSSSLKLSMALAFLVLLVLLAPAVHVVVGQEPGFLSIDCGLDDKYSGYTDQGTGIVYVPDGPYIDTGENHVVAVEYQSQSVPRRYLTVRSFPTGVRNCYGLPTVEGNKYLVRAEFEYGNYDGKNSKLVEFDLFLGGNFWETPNVSRNIVCEALFVAWAGWTPVCLVNTGLGTPFVSVLELRPLPGALYPPVTPGLSLSIYYRRSMGRQSSSLRFSDDPYDRIWWPMDIASAQWTNLSTELTIQPDPSFAVSSPILRTAVAAIGNDTVLTVTAWQDSRKTYSFMAFLHFADFQNTQLRQFDIYFNGNQLGSSYNPSSLVASCVYSSSALNTTTDGTYNITLAATAKSMLPPMINAFEIYNLIPHSIPTTFSKDIDAIIAIKFEYGIQKNWTGDPCFPTIYAWNGVKCSNISDDTTRITSLDLSNNNLRGVISTNFTLLTALENLDLSYNNLSGSIPDSIPSLSSLRVLNLSGNHLSGESLCKNYTGSLVFRYGSDGHMCNKTISTSKNRAVVIAISVVVPVLVVALLLLAYFVWREKGNPTVSTHDPTRDPPLESALGSTKIHEEHLPNTENRRFTYKDLEKFTNKFKQVIGKGGFGLVYYGRLEDDTDVAVKMRSESSSHGLDEFLAEVWSLTKVHHRNIVSLIGYCFENDHLALVYEYMSQGSLFDHLRVIFCENIEGKNGVAETFNWGTRVRVVLEAAQGLDYLHKGCSLPIIHRDVKSNNILLGQNLRAKIADLGLSRTYLSDAQTHISATAAGTPGYMDPEYYLTGRLTESSDVYSFGVVLLEVATGEPPMVPGHGHIVQRVKRRIATSDISSVVDARLGSAYDINSMWKVVDTAMMCTADSAAQRPTMAAVVVQLKESLALEEAREKDSIFRSDIAAMVSTFGPLAR
ncbi:probable LRR receptor-like serine/threonine-protein kinase At1g51810 isoform X4 [Phragmites australis]|uniref:probable LRR receptor-like serine/threonine-protein kinase At1g51810 isoform X4 n=1 Tax=Phragmites australis TaxID=29695 RepID=UPI002D76F0D8|nr:probable LRR receptor-like serine/threonine-protein kinase At1g51810 isoform X4 [Phragmites australis]